MRKIHNAYTQGSVRLSEVKADLALFSISEAIENIRDVKKTITRMVEDVKAKLSDMQYDPEKRG